MAPEPLRYPPKTSHGITHGLSGLLICFSESFVWRNTNENKQSLKPLIYIWVGFPVAAYSKAAKTYWEIYYKRMKSQTIPIEFRTITFCYRILPEECRLKLDADRVLVGNVLWVPVRYDCACVARGLIWLFLLIEGGEGKSADNLLSPLNFFLDKGDVWISTCVLSSLCGRIIVCFPSSFVTTNWGNEQFLGW